jgi:N-methylhydantoinase B/oxoprolinase/acetone carboxylase alpha subunit
MLGALLYDGADKTEMIPGDVFIIETPGGGGYGAAWGRSAMLELLVRADSHHSGS